MTINKLSINGTSYDIVDTNTVTSINGSTGAIAASDIAAVLTAAGHKLTDNNTWTAFAGASSTSNGTAGYVPAPGKGNQNKFFKADGTWAVPTDNNTTYTFSGGTNQFTVTPSGGSAQTVSVTPSISNNVTKTADLTADQIVLGSAAATVKGSGKSIATSVTNNANAIPTAAAVYNYVSTQVSSALASVLKYKGTVGTGGTVTALPSSGMATGDTYVVKTAGTYDSAAMEIGDYLIYNGSGWDKINGENQVTNKAESLAAAGSTATIATVDGTDITVKTPSTWTGLAKTGTVTSVATGAGLTGGTITGSGTIKANLVSETKLSSAAGTGKVYAVSLDSNNKLAVSVPWNDTDTHGTLSSTFTPDTSGGTVGTLTISFS